MFWSCFCNKSKVWDGCVLNIFNYSILITLYWNLKKIWSSFRSHDQELVWWFSRPRPRGARWRVLTRGRSLGPPVRAPHPLPSEDAEAAGLRGSQEVHINPITQLAAWTRHRQFKVHPHQRLFYWHFYHQYFPRASFLPSLSELEQLKAALSPLSPMTPTLET